MGFLQPLALLALPAAGIPLLLHLWRRRTPPRVPFPAIRYIARTTEEHRRRLRLQHLLLLLLRTVVVLALVLAAARPVVRGRVAGAVAHEPTALALVLDNSLSSGAVRAGTPTLDLLRDAARSTLPTLTATDQLWLVLADGVPRRMSPGAARAVVDSVGSWALRLELGDAVTQAVRAVSSTELPAREVHVFSDFQRSAVETAVSGGTVRIVAVRPPGEPPLNVGTGIVATREPIWGPSGGAVVTTPAGTPERETTVTLTFGGRPVARSAVRVGESAELLVPAPEEGWWTARLVTASDELLADNAAEVAVRVAPPAGVSVANGAGTFVEQAIAVLREANRLRAGTEVRIADLPTAGATLLVPPADPSRIGAVNRSLSARGIPWRYDAGGAGGLVGSSSIPGLEGAQVRRRYRLTAVDTTAVGVLAAVDGDPWLVRAADDLVLLGSRLDETWSDLPVRPGFVPALDHLLNLTLRGAVATLSAAPVEPVRLPDRVTGLVRGGERRTVEPGAIMPAPRDAGAYFLMAGSDTVGTLAVQPDPRESALSQASRSEVIDALGDEVELLVPTEYARGPFGAATRSEVAGLLLVLALVAVLLESGVAWRLKGARE